MYVFSYSLRAELQCTARKAEEICRYLEHSQNSIESNEAMWALEKALDEAESMLATIQELKNRADEEIEESEEDEK